MLIFKNNEDWFQKQPKETQEKIFDSFNGDFQAFLKWCEIPYKTSMKAKK